MTIDRAGVRVILQYVSFLVLVAALAAGAILGFDNDHLESAAILWGWKMVNDLFHSKRTD